MNREGDLNMTDQKKPARETPEQLKRRLDLTARTVPLGIMIRHRARASNYYVAGHSLRPGDLEPLVTYRTTVEPPVSFTRPASEVRSKFERLDGETWSDEQ